MDFWIDFLQLQARNQFWVFSLAFSTIWCFSRSFRKSDKGQHSQFLGCPSIKIQMMESRYLSLFCLQFLLSLWYSLQVANLLINRMINNSAWLMYTDEMNIQDSKCCWSKGKLVQMRTDKDFSPQSMFAAFGVNQLKVESHLLEDHCGLCWWLELFSKKKHNSHN